MNDKNSEKRIPIGGIAPEYELISRLTSMKKTLSTAESCTGGELGARLTSVPGASACYRGGVISYCNEVKASVLHVPQTVLDTLGAVSAETAKAMAEGVRKLLCADYGVSVTGVAGPSPSEGKPVGTVYIAVASDTETKTFALSLPADAGRENIRRMAEDRLIAELLSTTEDKLC